MPCQYPILKVLLIAATGAFIYWLCGMVICSLAWAIAMIRKIWIETGDDWEDIL